jgi:hypothetical protein
MPLRSVLRFRVAENQVVSCSVSVRSWEKGDADVDMKFVVICLVY